MKRIIGKIYGGYYDGATLLKGLSITKNIKWWGWDQWYKFRWNKTHIDLGVVSIYNLKRIWFWQIVAWVIKPLRILYHHRCKGW